MLARNVKEICSTIFPFSFQFKVFILLQGLFFVPPSFPFPFFPFSFLFLTALVAHDACRAAENRSKGFRVKMHYV